MSVARLFIPVYIQHSALYSIWIFLWMDGSAADSAMSCQQFPYPDTATTVFKDDGCFLLSREERTWEESKTFCNGLGDGWSLVVIEDVETQKHVDNVSRTAGVSTWSWIGLRQRNGFTWVSGNKLVYPSFFKELAEGEVQVTGDCVVTSPPHDTASYGIWSYMDCTARLYSICHTGSSLPPRKTTTCRPTTTSTTTLNETPAKPQMTVKYRATQSTATATQSPAAATQSTAAATQSTATTTQSTATTTQSTATITQSTASTTQSTATTTQSTATTTQYTEAATTQSTAATTTATSSTTVLIAVSSTAAFVAAVFLVVGVILLCRRNKQKRLRVRTNDDTESGTVADVRTKPEVEYAVVTKIQTKQSSKVHACNTESGYHYASVDDGALPMKQGVNDQTYDTATGTEKIQPITFDNTYARAIFSQSASDTGDDVYDHTCVTGKASQEVNASHYDHAFVK